MPTPLKFDPHGWWTFFDSKPKKVYGRMIPIFDWNIFIQAAIRLLPNAEICAAKTEKKNSRTTINHSFMSRSRFLGVHFFVTPRHKKV